MSSVVIAGDTSGTVTLDAPAVAGSTVITLPASGGSLFTQGNILGTVSQSSGVPTGAIIERGSNANGEFVKYADGTLICMQGWVVNLAISTSSFGGFRSAGQLWTYPVSFVGSSATIYPFANTKRLDSGFGARCVGETVSSVEWIVTAITSTAASDRYVSTMAIGRWF